MSHMTRSVCELLPSAACDLYAPRPDPVDSRTVLKQYILDPVLPMLTLLSMSALTIVMLVTIVTTVADMDLRPPDNYIDVDPWAGVQLGSVGAFYRDQDVYVDSAPAPVPAQDRVDWPNSPAGDPF